MFVVRHGCTSLCVLFHACMLHLFSSAVFGAAAKHIACLHARPLPPLRATCPPILQGAPFSTGASSITARHTCCKSFSWSLPLLAALPQHPQIAMSTPLISTGSSFLNQTLACMTSTPAFPRTCPICSAWACPSSGLTLPRNAPRFAARPLLAACGSSAPATAMAVALKAAGPAK